MPGVVTAAELDTMTKLSGPDFDAAATGKLDEVVAQSIVLARGEQENGTDPRTRALAAEILAVRSA
ncbi:hypothetical protein AB0G04_12220 [Actinoplanes sp. NPDC023801]|uniref:hypothetical protein n=1 Tax=Actinoplanes sp. NPDC023801 TaxID=3154595 RepID=UPI0033F65EA3